MDIGVAAVAHAWRHADSLVGFGFIASVVLLVALLGNSGTIVYSPNKKIAYSLDDETAMVQAIEQSMPRRR